MHTNRREFLGYVAAAAGATFVSTKPLSAATGERKRIAFLGTEVRTHSHA
ncbi:MAG: twin-arginine translocation signal domain-containing protein, partial [Planctomycetales bacterium]|nr:twin-arginine translocation signal domain-containing protein [Planctomycetales bacterium]